MAELELGPLFKRVNELWGKNPEKDLREICQQVGQEKGLSEMDISRLFCLIQEEAWAAG